MLLPQRSIPAQTAIHQQIKGVHIMSSIQQTHTAAGAKSHTAAATIAAPAAAGANLPASLMLLLSAGAGLAVASLYYSQPMLGILGADIGASDRAVGMVPMLTQLGYALGILLLAPLGDRSDRRTAAGRRIVRHYHAAGRESGHRLVGNAGARHRACRRHAGF